MSKTATMSTSASEIPLRRLSLTRYSPSIFSTTSTLPPSYASSIASTTQGLIPSSTTPFNPTAILQIQSVGKAMISFPLSTNELCIPIFACDGDGKTGRPKWLSIRPARKSGSCFLVDAEDESQTAVARTRYRFGPGRPPVVRIGRDEDGFVESDEEDVCLDANAADDVDKKADSNTATARVGHSDGISENCSTIDAEEFPLISRRLIGRTIQFTSPRHGTFEWRYCSRKEKASFPSTSNSVSSAPNNLLVLEKVFKNEHGKECGRMRVAQLIRGEETRSPGSRESSAGNGGRLEMCLSRGGGGEGEGEVLIDEVTVVVTVMVMLKKEIDRLRGAQIAVMSAGASGGGP
ncbi:hypothetical protein IFR05_002386 [Cadophora sp. M221]|nr:hypothetical protein IFR05_002386 [Cadophora sp. M221]